MILTGTVVQTASISCLPTGSSLTVRLRTQSIGSQFVVQPFSPLILAGKISLCINYNP